MRDAAAWLKAIQAQPRDHLLRLTYADWLEERGDPLAEFIRLELALRYMAPDDPRRLPAEVELSRARLGAPADWLKVIEGPHDHLHDCECLRGGDLKAPPREDEAVFHVEAQDTECPAWLRLCKVIDQAAIDRRTEFHPLHEIPLEERDQIRTLPPSIAKLTKVRTLNLYSSRLIRIPPEIGEMRSLQELFPYTSYRLHWFPYEITRCKQLKKSTVSTRALYGNFKYRPAFPRVDPAASTPPAAVAQLAVFRQPALRACSVCKRSFADEGRHRAWVSLNVATDVLPLLVNACSSHCLERLPPGAMHHVEKWHQGGLGVKQPKPR